MKSDSKQEFHSTLPFDSLPKEGGSAKVAADRHVLGACVAAEQHFQQDCQGAVRCVLAQTSGVGWAVHRPALKLGNLLRAPV